MAKESLATAWIQLVPSFDDFEKNLVSQMDKAADAVKRAGENAGKAYAQAFASGAGTIEVPLRVAGADQGAGELASGIKEAAAQAGADGGRVAGDEFEKNLDARKTGEEAGQELGAGLGWGISAAIGTALGGIGTGLLATLSSIGATFQDVNRTIIVGTGAAGVALKGLNEDAREVARGTASGFGEVSAAIADINTRLGLTGAPLRELSEQFLDLSRLTGTDISQNITAVTRLFNNWGVVTGDQALQLDKLFVASQKTGIGVDRLASQVTAYGAQLRQFGVGLDQSVALLASFEKEGVNAERAFAGLTVALRSFANEGRDPALALRELITQIQEADTTAAATALGAQKFGRGFAELTDAIRSGRFDIDEFVVSLGGAGGAISRTADEAKTFGERMSEAFDRLLTVVEPATESAVVGLEAFASGIEGVANVIDLLPTGAKQALGTATALSAALLASSGAAAVAVTGYMRLRLVIDAYTASAGRATFATKTLTGALALAKGAGLFGAIATGVALVADPLLDFGRRITGVADQAQAGLARLERSLEDGATSITDFGAAVDTFQDRVGFFDQFKRAATGIFDGGGKQLVTFNAYLMDIRGTLDEIGGSQGVAGLRQLQTVLQEAQAATEQGSQAWDDYALVLGEVETRLRSLGEVTGGEAAGRIIAQEQSRLNLELEEGVAAAGDLGVALEDLASKNRLSAEWTSFNAEAADAYRQSVERATQAASLFASALAVGAAFRSARQGFGLEFSSQQQNKIADAAGKSAKAKADNARQTNFLTEALRRFDPQASATVVRFRALDAAASAFGDSIKQSTSLPSTISSGLSLGNAFDDFRRTFRRLPGEIDMVSLSLGKYRPRQRDAIQNLLKLGDSTRDYLQTLISQGASSAKVRSEAERLRAAYVDQFKALGLTDEQLKTYLETLGLTPEQIDTAIKVSGLEESRFKVQTYLNLLNNRIPPEKATQIVALIDSGDLDGAAKALADWARTNPAPLVDIPVAVSSESTDRAVGAVRDVVGKIERELDKFPDTLDIGKALLGEYTEAEQRGLERVITLASTANSFIADLVAAGQGDAAKTWADQIIAGARDLLEELGVPKGAIDDILEQLGFLDGAEVEALIRVSGADTAIAKIGLIRDLLGEDGGLPPELEAGIRAKIYDDAQGAMELLRWFTTRREQGADDQQILAELGLIDTPARVAWKNYTDFITEGPVQAILDADDALARAKWDGVLRDVDGKPITPILGIDDIPARRKYDNFGMEVTGATLEPKLDLDVTKARESWRRFLSETQGLDVFAAMTGGRLRNPARTPGAADGGYIEGPGTSTSDSILARLSNGEYVLRASTVRALGTELLDRVNRTGRLPRFSEGGMVPAAPAPSTGITGPSIQYTVVEAKSKPRPEDMVRVVGSVDFLGKFG